MTELSRRNLLKTVAVGGVAAAAAPLASAAAAPKFDQTADVVVVGFGGAGAATAITAADNGASVIVIERQPEATLRSNTRMSGGIFHCPDKKGDKKALKEYAKAMFSGENIPGKLEGEQPEVSDGLAQAWADYTPGLLDWMKSLDPKFQAFATPGFKGAAFPNFPGAKDCGYQVYRSSYPDRIPPGFNEPCYGKPKEQAISGEAFWQCLANGVKTRAKKIKVIYETRGLELVTNDDGEVIGVITEQKGKKVAFKAKKAVVLCSGGYEYHKPMRQAFLEGPGVEGWAFYGTIYNEGDGIRMGLDAGASLTKAGSCAARMIWAPPVEFNGMRIGVTTNGIGSPHSIVVNSLGERFANESLITGGITNNCFYEKACEQSLKTLTFDNLPSWLVMDETMFNSRQLANVTRSTVGYGFVDFKNNADALKKGWILKGSTIEELASKIAATGGSSARMKPETLKRTIDAFNADCRAGRDTLFGRSKSTLQPVEKAPFFAIPLFAGGSNTKGGLATTADREVLDWSGKAIPGLYAVGEIACGLNRGGAMLTDALVFGIVCGKKMTQA